MPKRPKPDDDPLLATILEAAAGVRHEDVDLDLDDPAFRALVDRAVAQAAPVLTPEGLEHARSVATVALATHPDIDEVLARLRSPEPPPPAGASGVRPSRSPERLADVARRGPRGKR